MQRLDREDREYARHQVEQHPADQRAEQRQQHGAHADLAHRLAAARHRAWHRFERQAAPVAQREHAGQTRRRATLALEVGDQPVTLATKALRRGEIDRAVFAREDIGLADRHRCRKGQREMKRPRVQREPPGGGERSRQRTAPLVEPVTQDRRAIADRQVERDRPVLGNTHFLGTGEPLRLGADREDPARPRRHRQPDQQRIVFLVDVIDDSREKQPGRHRIAQRRRRHAGRKLPVDTHRETGFARVLPIAVPAGRRVHDDGEIERLAGPGAALGDQFRLDRVAAARQPTGRGRSVEHQHNQGEEEAKQHYFPRYPPSRAASSALNSSHRTK